MAYSRDRTELTLILAVVLPIMLAFILGVAGSIVPLFRAMQVKLDKLNLVLRENLTGIRVITGF
jgi:ATP-binding cassette subfamily B protein